MSQEPVSSESPSDRLRVAVVFPTCGKQGGVERAMWEAARYLSGRHEVHLVSREFGDPVPEVTWHQIPAARYQDPIGLLEFRRAAAATVSALRPDVTVSYGIDCPPGDVLVVGSVHRAWLEQAGELTVRDRRIPGTVRYASPRNAVRLALEYRYFHAGAAAVAPCSARVVEDLARIYGVPSERCTVVNNGFDPAQFSPARRAELRAEARKAYGFGPDDIVLVMVANEWQRKGLGTVLDAMADLRDPRIRLLLVGRRPPTAFDPKIDQLRLREAVTYAGPSDDVAREHAAADLFVLPTQYEAFALAIVEALASGLPVITTEVPGAGDLIQPDVNGLLLADPEDAQALAALLDKGLDPAARARWSEGAGPTVVHLQWDALMAKLETVLRQAALNRRR